LSAAFQLCIFAPFLIIPLFLWKKWGLILNVIVILFGIIAPIIQREIFGIKYINEALKIGENEYINSFDNYQFFTYNHIHTFAFGILIGYLIKRHPNIYLGGKFGETLLGIICLGLTLWSQIWHHNWRFGIEIDKKMTIPPNNFDDIKLQENAGFYNDMLWTMFDKFFWVIGFAWMFFMSATGRARMFNT
jgi:hypothetical protein